MELNSIRTNKHISVASSRGAGVTMDDIMNTRCQSGMMDAAWEQNTGSHKLCPIGHITMDSPDTGVRTNIGRAGAHGNCSQTPDIRHLGGRTLFFRLFGLATFAMQMGYTFSDFEMLKSFHPI